MHETLRQTNRSSKISAVLLGSGSGPGLLGCVPAAWRTVGKPVSAHQQHFVEEQAVEDDGDKKVMARSHNRVFETESGNFSAHGAGLARYAPHGPAHVSVKPQDNGDCSTLSDDKANESLFQWRAKGRAGVNFNVPYALIPAAVHATYPVGPHTDAVSCRVRKERSRNLLRYYYCMPLRRSRR